MERDVTWCKKLVGELLDLHRDDPECPEADTLIAFSCGDLNGIAYKKVLAHMLFCKSCMDDWEVVVKAMAHFDKPCRKGRRAAKSTAAKKPAGRQALKRRQA